jgi:hypothetical protein
MSIIDRLLLACLRSRLRGDDTNEFMGAVVLSIAARTREQCLTVEAQKAVERTIAQVALQTVALNNFAELEAGEVARQ